MPLLKNSTTSEKEQRKRFYSSNKYLEYANSSIDILLEKFNSSMIGLTESEAEERLERFGFNEPAKKEKLTVASLLFYKFFNPLVIVLIIIAILSLFFGEKGDAVIVLLIAIVSVLLSFVQEYRAGKEADKLSEMVHTTATVFRDGKSKEINIREIVPGDVVELSAGDMIPADLRIISNKDLFINQASLTGEAFPIEKFSAQILPNNNSISDLTNIAFMGSSVVSGSAQGLVIETGISTQFGELSRKVASMHIETNFDKGIRKFTWLMIRFMIILVLIIFGINLVFKHNPIEALLFSLAVAVGLTPEMLPMLVAINLAKGAINISKKKVIVKRLNSIQNIGAMDVLCTDKTGTITLDSIVLEKYCDVVGTENDEDVLRLAYINSLYQTGLKNLLDRAVLDHKEIIVKQYKKIDEIPFDFSRKIMSVVVEMDGKYKMISKGAPEEIFKRCTKCEIDGEILDLEYLIITDLKEEYDKLSAQGFRVLAIAYKDVDAQKQIYSKEDEKELVLKGYVAFLDPPKPTAKETIEALKKRGIQVKVITGDNELVTKKICGDVGLDISGLVTGDMIEKLNDVELKELVKTVTVFARISPIQKGKIVNALHENGHTVGYLGDGINDAPALKASDVGISVNNAVDIAKESADIILLEKNLMILDDAVIEGRKTFGNIIKYIKMGASSNFGNMFSMTGASIILPFLPMLPVQVLLNNFLYDLSQIGIPTDEVDQEYLMMPKPWNVESIKKYMIIIGPISSLFDFVTFGILWYIFHASEELFHTGWFLESLCTQTLVIYIIRTGKIPFIESMPGKFLMLSSIVIVCTGLLLPFTPFAESFGFVQPPHLYFIFLVGIIFIYLASVQLVKSWFIKRYGYE